MLYFVTPVPKPRMTQRDKWKKRASVVRYHEFKDFCKKEGVEIFPRMEVRFYIPMPASWSNKKRKAMSGKPHQQKPDLDNLVKALLDACMAEDQSIWHVDASKMWAGTAAIEIVEIGEWNLNEREIV